MALLFAAAGPHAIAAATLEEALVADDPQTLADAARERGDAARGAIVFHQPHMSCAKCHLIGQAENPLGPDLTHLPEDANDVYLVESLLRPSKAIRKGFEPVTAFTEEGMSVTGLLIEETDDKLVLHDAENIGKVITLAKDELEVYARQTTSVMPVGQVNQLASRQQFLDLILYLIEIRDGGPERAEELRPPPSAIALKLPEYEQHVDHAGLIADLGDENFQSGEAIYNRVCLNCHGTHDQVGSLPTSLKFASGQFKNGMDPFTMYQTLTRGFGMMVPQTWMVPQQKYDVIHYIREAYLREHNESQYFDVVDDYLTGLPEGDTRGPEPTVIEPWITMDYGPCLVNTYEVGNDGSNFAYKGIAVRLDPGPGGVSRGTSWMIFDHDTLRVAAGWTGEGFIDWNGIHFNGRHQVHPRIVGDVHFANPTGPGWANPETGRFDDPRLRGRDGKPYGPLPRAWARYRGLYHYEHDVVLSYTVGDTDILEMPGMSNDHAVPLFTRNLNLGPRKKKMVLQVARHPSAAARLRILAPSPTAMASIAVLEVEDGFVADATGNGHDGNLPTGTARVDRPGILVAGVSPPLRGVTWESTEDGHLRLHLPAGEEEVKFTLWVCRLDQESDPDVFCSTVELADAGVDLAPMTQGGRPRWTEILTAEAVVGGDEGPFAVDTLTHPASNPWLAQMRFTGFDFFPGGDRAAVSAWDGDVWLVSGLNQLARNGSKAGATEQPGTQLTWQRIASGLFQPLGLRMVDGRIYVNCRDQITILHDLNQDGETDYYECFNNDHQVTDHFHEFAMDLQTDAEGNFYYAKAARHALPALVPQHGTLLRVSKDGSRTDILANGFRAPNGVCLNPDGTFFVTDQEGHCTPKNRINLVEVGRR
ncbi:MAG: DUF6797 domain-containing protein, partial [Pirellulaceae bacterium]